MTIQTRSGAETTRAGENFAKQIKNGGIVCLYGDLGAGKTTFVQGVARGLKIKQKVISPTFIIIRRYVLPQTRFLWHIDLYRLNDLEETRGLGIEEILSDPKSITLIEWPEKIEPLLPRRRWEVHLERLKENARDIEIKELK